MTRKEEQWKCENQYSLIVKNYIIEELKVKVLKVEPTSKPKADGFEATVICEWVDPNDNNLKYKHYELAHFLEEARACR